jgi:hypothetical protein
MSACTSCTAGQYCSETTLSVTVPCTQGHYCPTGTILPIACPAGTYNINTLSTSSTDCTACPAQYYCDEQGMVNFNTNKRCASGYICTGGASSAYPIETETSAANRKCPTGSFCSTGAISGSPCTDGKFQNSFGQSSCKSCPPGYYCSGSGLATPTGECLEGYTCFDSATTSSPTDGTTGAVCIVTEFCVTGSAKGLSCADGTKTTTTTQATCTNCAAGKWCTRSVEYDCQTRKYCVAGSVRGKICDAGTYNDGTLGLSLASQCSSCPERMYCIDGTAGSGFCESGHICGGGATTPLPTGTFGTDLNYDCPLGRYCLKSGSNNALAPTDCSASKYTYSLNSDALDDCLPCAAGFFCPTGGYVPVNCPVGQFCEKGVTSAADCPINTFRDTENAEYERACSQCTGGYFCDIITLTTISGKECSTGKFCPIATDAEINCPAGTYNALTTQNEVGDCQP